MMARTFVATVVAVCNEEETLTESEARALKGDLRAAFADFLDGLELAGLVSSYQLSIEDAPVE